MNEKADHNEKCVPDSTNLETGLINNEEQAYATINKGPVSPENFAWLPSRLVLWWLNDFFWKGYRHRIQEDDIYEMLDINKSAVLTGNLLEKWEAEKKRAAMKLKTPSLLKAIIMAFWRRYYTIILGLECGDACQISGPLVLQQVIKFVNASDSPNPPAAWHGYGLAIGMVCLQLTQNVFYQRWNLGSVTMGIYIRTALIDLVFRKATTLSSRAHLVYPDGAIVNLMSTDASRIDTAMLSMLLVISVPIYTTVIVGLLIHLMGPSALLGAAMLLLVNPIQAWAMSKLAPIRKRASQFTDSRIRLTSEILQGIKVIKFFGWELQFLEKLSNIRKSELYNVAKLLYIRGAVAATSASLPVFASALSFVLYGAIGNELRSEIIFPALAYFTVLRTPLMVLPSAYTVTIDAYVALKRIQAFLLSEDADPIPPPDSAHEYALSMNEASFVWDQLQASNSNGSSETLVPNNVINNGAQGEDQNEATTVMSNETTAPRDVESPGATFFSKLDIQIPRGALVAVVGPVGSGKSSLLQAIIGNMTLSQGRVTRGTNISYASQTAWIQNATIRDNILFDTPFDKERYWRVIKACCLEQDLALFSNGDFTEIGERGVNMSGGQKARLSLARSVYFDSGMVIMDDPLSAVDAHVGKRLWEDCILTELRNRTRIIATHQLHVLPDVDYVICMKDGTIAEEGRYKELMEKNGDFCALMSQYGGVNPEDQEVNVMHEGPTQPAGSVKDSASGPTASSSENISQDEQANNKDEIYSKDMDGEHRRSLEAKAEATQKLVTEEERESGAVKSNVYAGYLKSSGWHLWAITFGLFFLQQLANVIGNQWMSWWSEDEFQLTTREYIGAYIGFALAQLVLVFAAAMMLSFTITKTANNMHDAAFKSVLYSPLAFFDTNPLGRVINRFSRDVDTLDNVLWSTLYEFTFTVVTLLGTLILIIVVFPWLVLAIVPILGLYYMLSIYYRTTSREVKRLDSNMRSYLYAYFTESLTGLGILKAYNVVDNAILKNESKIDLSNRPYYLYQLGARWLSMRVNVLGSLMNFSTIILITATRFQINPASAGLVLSYLARFSGDLNWGVQRLSTLENNMNSAERLVYYVENLVQERPPHKPENPSPDAAWPSEGAISFKNVSMRYRDELPRVLRNISFDIQPGHKVGVVGRTGAGKSSLIHALFLLSELDSGEIVIDGLNTSTLGTVDLRPKIGIIPQDPVLFQGTFRYNLDPLGQHTEQELWQVLETSDLKSYVQAQEGGLDAPISDQGENLSVGQRQLVCLSRALLAKSRVVVLDEATASVDMATDTLIQKAIRNDFAHSTVITVAHRINTIIDYDRILVMNQGQVAEYDTPHNLLSDPNSVFSSMVAETGAQNASHLRSLAGL